MKKFCYFMFALCLILNVNMVSASTINRNYIYNNNVIKTRIDSYSKYSNMLRTRTYGNSSGNACDRMERKYGKNIAVFTCNSFLYFFGIVAFILLGIKTYCCIKPPFIRDKINIKKVPYVKDLPFNDDILLANFVMRTYGFERRSIDLMGALILKWLIEGKISINRYSSIKTVMQLSSDVNITNNYEQEFYDLLVSACSPDYTIEIWKFRISGYMKMNNYFRFYKKFVSDYTELCKNSGLIISDEFNSNGNKLYKGMFNEYVHNNAINMVGLKNYLLNISKDENINSISKDLFNKYLIYAEMYGITDKFYKQLKKASPNNSMFFENYYNVKFINKLCYAIVTKKKK